jgi:hypothetical protein
VSYSVLHTYGTLDDDLPKERFRELLDALPTIDAEHGVVSVTHNETGLTVEAMSSGSTYLLNADDSSFPVRRSDDLDIEERLRRLLLAADGELDLLLQRPWDEVLPPPAG